MVHRVEGPLRRRMGWMLLATAMPVAAQAQDAPATAAPTMVEMPQASAARYTPADFARFAPRTALDMVEQLPGFTIVTGSNGGARGLGAARENVLINGERIASKTVDARTALARIAASDVGHIDIVDGASLNVPGLTGQVANVVLIAGAGGGFKTTLRWQPEWRPRLADNWLNGELSTTGTLGGSQLTLSLTNEANRNGHWGPEQVFDGNGVRLFTRDEFAAYSGDRPRLSAALARTAANGNKLNINAGVQRIFNRQRVDGTSDQPGRGPVDERYRFRENEWNADIGGDYEFALGGGRLKLIALQRIEHSPTVAFFTVTDAASVDASRFDFTADESESILRGEYSWRTGGGTDWQVALEGAFNRLDVDSALALLGPGGVFVPLAGGAEQTEVSERRADASLTWGRALAPNLTAQLNLGAEYSRIQSSGPFGQTQSFVRPKGRLALAWKVTPKTTLNWVLQRQVLQLDFFDFASSFDLQNNNGNTGNGGLKPPVNNRTELELVQDLGKWGNASVAVAHARPVGLIDQIPLSPTTEGRGNLPAARLYRVSSRATILLDPLGWKGAKLTSDMTWRRNRVRDPLTGAWRNQSYGQHYIVDLALRHDIPGSNWAWGAGMFDEEATPGLRLDAIEREFTDGPFVTAFVEHKNVAGFTVKLSFRNLAGMVDALDRTIFADRRDGPIAFSESRRRRFGRYFQLTVTGTL